MNVRATGAPPPQPGGLAAAVPCPRAPALGRQSRLAREVVFLRYASGELVTVALVDRNTGPASDATTGCSPVLSKPDRHLVGSGKHLMHCHTQTGKLVHLLLHSRQPLFVPPGKGVFTNTQGVSRRSELAGRAGIVPIEIINHPAPRQRNSIAGRCGHAHGLKPGHG
jgi:hypothetical protein